MPKKKLLIHGKAQRCNFSALNAMSYRNTIDVFDRSRDCRTNQLQRQGYQLLTSYQLLANYLTGIKTTFLSSNRN